MRFTRHEISTKSALGEFPLWQQQHAAVAHYKVETICRMEENKAPTSLPMGCSEFAPTFLVRCLYFYGPGEVCSYQQFSDNLSFSGNSHQLEIPEWFMPVIASTRSRILYARGFQYIDYSIYRVWYGRAMSNNILVVQQSVEELYSAIPKFP